MIASITFILVFILAVLLFTKAVRRISQNIKLGKDVEIKDNKRERWKMMFLVAIGQSKMTTRPVPALMHILVYVGFIIVNIEMLEILIDGIFGTHRLFSFFGELYSILISVFEVFAISVMFGCVVFLIRRNILRLKRFWSKEMKLWPRSDANIILITELFLMSSIFIMNASDSILQMRPGLHYVSTEPFLISSLIQPWFEGLSDGTLIFIERFCWWFHIVGVLAFLNYIPHSKHFHVFLAFPNVFYSKLRPRGVMTNMPAITKEVKLMLDENFAEPAEDEAEEISFGAKRIKDLSWKNLMDAYTCTECGRCTSVCPANITGKDLSPRKIMMDVRDRLEEIGKVINKLPAEKRKEYDDDKSLFDYIIPEELWACTTCNACTMECPVNIDQVAIILEMRRHLVMEESSAPAPLNNMFSNIENNGAPWQYSPDDRLLWTNE
ncbi:4Fe-4S dicluster domain-containing protein [Bacteroidota bacterium]